MSDQESKFLDRKGTLEQMENYNFISIFGSKENPSFLPCHIFEKMFFTEVARQVRFGKTTVSLIDCRRFRSISGSIFRTRSLGYDLRETLPINAKCIEESLYVGWEEP
jgi:hypothetical protein